MERTGEGGARELELLTHALALDAWWQGSERATEALLLRAARLEQQRLRADKSEDRELFMQLAGAPGSLIALSRLYEEKGREADAERILREGRSFMEGVVGDQSEAMNPYCCGWRTTTHPGNIRRRPLHTCAPFSASRTRRTDTTSKPAQLR